MSFLNSGIFGLGGMDGFAPAVPSQLANIYDKKGMKKAQIKSLLTNAGIAMLAQGPSQLPINLGTSIGQGLQAGMKAADQTGQDYRDVAYQTFKINQDQEALARQQEQQAYERKRQGINDQWAQQEHAHQQQSWQEQQSQKKNWDNYVSTLRSLRVLLLAARTPGRQPSQKATLPVGTRPQPPQRPRARFPR
jgi:hypothetical protein